MLSETDANGAVTTATYDKFGRLTGLRKPGDPSPNRATLVVSYFDANYLLYQKPYRVDIQQKINESTVYAQRKLYNGLGQLIQEQTAGAQLASGSKDVVVDYAYDANGALVQQTTPYELATWDGITPETPYRGQQLNQPSTHSAYDVLGRPTAVSAPDATQQTYAYTQTVQNGFSYRVTKVTDGRGNVDTSWTDLWGRTAQVIPPTGPGVSYTYDEADRLTNALYGSASTTMLYDLAGRKTSMTDDDMGSWSYTYDALGTLKTQTDARGCVTTLGYDVLNRLTSKTYTGPGACDSPTPDVSYSYDAYDPANGQYGKTRRTGMTDNGSNTTSWKYDGRGRVVQEVKVISGSGTFKSEWFYNSADLLDWMKYPADNNGNLGEAVVYSYHPQMLVNNVWGTNTYVQTSGYDAAGRVDVRLLGESSGNAILRTDYDYFAWNDSNGSGRLNQIKSDDLSPVVTPLQDLRYYNTQHRRTVLRRGGQPGAHR